MRLTALLAEMPESSLELLALEHLRTNEKLPRPQLCNLLEAALRNFLFVSGFILNRQPPAFSILTLLLESPGYERKVEGFREAVMGNTFRLVEAIAQGDLLGRDGQLHLYRRALYEARRNDLDVNTSEAALLAVLRHEQRITQVEHFLLEHHEDFREFWDYEACYEHEENALRRAGIVFESNGRLVIPEEVALSVWQSLGIDMSTESARRLYGYLSNSELAAILETAQARVSGSKEHRLERIVAERIQPRLALQSVGLVALKEICRATDAVSTGNKDELIERIVGHFSQGRDKRVEEPMEVRLREPRRLEKAQFEALFGTLLQQELTDILRGRPELRQTGTKEIRVNTLWGAELAEVTILNELMNRQLEDVLARLGERISGSKGARIERLIYHFEGALPTAGGPMQAEGPAPEDSQDPPAHSTEVMANQAGFRQRVSNPQTSLQPWLERLLNADGRVRCYATEDQNPTKQLKNKLSQAAAARDGVLVLLLADEAACAKAREALVERWLANSEWSKSVVCVALAFPLGKPSIAVIVQRSPNTWAPLLVERIFPEAEVVNAACERDAGKAACSRCARELPDAARFCPECGFPVVARQL